MDIDYTTLKTVHILSAILLFGTGLGSAFYKFFVDRSGNVQAIAVTTRLVVTADWLFTVPTIIIQPVTGIWMMLAVGWPLTTPWLMWSIALYILAGACWLPVVYLQIRMRELARECAASGTALPAVYHRMARIWFLLGIPAFLAMVVTVYLMVAKPSCVLFCG